MKSQNRRIFLLQLASASTAAGAGLLTAPEALAEHGPQGQRLEPAASERAQGPIRFDHGVASGDPLSDRVILWTHARRPRAQQPIWLRWEVSLDARFRRIVSAGWVRAASENGFTAKVDATGLRPGQRYFYRFRTWLSVSPVGITRTLPEKGVQQVRLAVFSCSNYPAGYFHAYSEAVRAGAEYALHLGDYIYEYGAAGYASEDAQAMGRTSRPAHELLTLDDYRERYAQYRSDPDLKQLHAHLPMIAIWDDHEIANNAWTDGAENHDPATEGAYGERVRAALQAYHEWMPIRTPDPTDLRKIYRSFDFGDLLSLHMLETRLLGRDRPIELLELVHPATAVSAATELASPRRQMLGVGQQDWLTGELMASNARWQVLGQQVLMGRMAFPVSVLQALNPANTSPEAQAAAMQAVGDYLRAKAVAAVQPSALTPAQQALLNPRLNPQLGYNLDAWDGYPAAREILLGTVAALGKRLVVLAGDTHNAWHNDLTLMDGTKVGEEFATHSVSSPGLEKYLATIAPAQTAAIFRGVVDTLRYCDTHRRGFLLMSFTPEAATGAWHVLDTVKSSSYTVGVAHTASYPQA